MNDTFINDETSTNKTQRSESKNSHFITDTNFQNLIHTLDEIYDTTQVKPSLKKLVNLIIEQTDIDIIKQQLIDQYS
jgi:hypothetical protein